MTLGRLLGLSEDAITCDLAETYHIYDFYKLPPLKVAVFVCGLRDDSRIMLKLNDQKVSIDRIISAKTCDNLSILVWSKSKDAQNGINRPKLFTDVLLGRDEEKKVQSFADGDEFMKAWFNNG